jgi:hypothetical protein
MESKNSAFDIDDLEGVEIVTDRPIRRLLALSDVPADHIGHRTEVQRGAFGRGLSRRRGTRNVLVYTGRDGIEYEDPLPVEFYAADKQGKLAQHPLFCGMRIDIEQYSHQVLARYELPRPNRPGYFREDGSSNRITAHFDIGNVGPGRVVTGLWEPVGEKWIEQNIEADPLCWEAVYASDFLDLCGCMIELVSASPPTAFALGEELGAVRAEWRLGLIHGRWLFGRDKAAISNSERLTWDNRARALARRAWQDKAVAMARSDYPAESNLSKVARQLVRRLELKFTVKAVAAVLKKRQRDWRVG